MKDFDVSIKAHRKETAWDFLEFMRQQAITFVKGHPAVGPRLSASETWDLVKKFLAETETTVDTDTKRDKEARPMSLSGVIDQLPKIQNCPWCGSPGKIHLTKYNFRIECRRTFDCAVKGPVRDTRTEAILIWNRVTARPIGKRLEAQDNTRILDLG